LYVPADSEGNQALRARHATQVVVEVAGPGQRRRLIPGRAQHTGGSRPESRSIAAFFPHFLLAFLDYLGAPGRLEFCRFDQAFARHRASAQRNLRRRPSP
jgi:hypothetical protein